MTKYKVSFFYLYFIKLFPKVIVTYNKNNRDENIYNFNLYDIIIHYIC